MVVNINSERPHLGLTLKTTILTGSLLTLLLLLVGCSPMPRASYGLHKYLVSPQDLNTVDVDITVGSTVSTMWACTKESLRRGEVLPVLFSLGLIPGCTWVDIWVTETNGVLVGTIKRCTGYATPSTYCHELEHCKGYKDHPLLELFN